MTVLKTVLGWVALSMVMAHAGAQQVIGSDAAALPDAPEAAGQSGSGQTATGAAAPEELKQPKRILGIVPNFRSVSAGEKLPPQTVKEKFTTGLQDSFDYSAFIFVGIQAGIAEATKSTPEFRQGAAGYGRYYWHTFADTADENLWVESILPSALHQDSRYYTLGHGGLLKRSGYALTRSLVTRKDDGSATPNYSEVVGAGAAAGISSLYYPGQERDWTKVGQRWLTSVLIDSGTFEFKEFWPDINNAFSRHKDQ